MSERASFTPGALVEARGREWVVLPSAEHEDRENLLRLRPLSGSEKDATLIYLPLESEAPKQAVFPPPNPEKHKPGSKEAALLLRDALQLKLRSGAGPFRSFGKLHFDPRAYQLAPLLMALKMETTRLLIADDVGIGKTIEAGLIAKELIERGEIEKFTVLCPPHLCEQWKSELEEKFNIRAEVVRTGTVTRLERDLLSAGESIFDVIPFTIVSLDYIKQDKRRDEFLRACPDFVIIDEAHACVRSGAGKTRHRRYELVKKLAEKQDRGMVLLTATPHSGDQQAFANLLGLLDQKFTPLAEPDKGDDRKNLREALALHFIQRRRADIDEWKDDNAGFPRRESRETTYRLSGDWSGFFDEVLNYARTIVRRSEGGTDLQRRMSWWAALALLRCASSSPAAAEQALKTKLQAPEGASDKDRVDATDRKGMEMVLDESDDDSLSLSETAPAGDIADTQDDMQHDRQQDIESLRSLIERTRHLRGPDRDPKLKKLIDEITSLIDDGFRPVIFCRYIATAHYVGEALKVGLKTKAGKKLRVDIITGELTPDQRKERIDALGNATGEEEGDVSSLPLLVATDCLSEGINLQSFFDAAIHYDLAWNPTRHEQREGRVDRFGQSAKVVRTLMLYGENNTVDWAVMRVILRKAEMIRKELGISVPLPTNNTKVIEAVMEAVLSARAHLSQSALFEKTEADVEREWKQSSERHRRTVFAQQSLKPEEVLPEFQKATTALGGEEDVERFVHRCAERLGAPLDERRGYRILPTMHLPKPLQDRLEDAGLPAKPKIAFDGSAPKGTLHIHRTHPLVSTLAEHVVECALDNRTGSTPSSTMNEDDFLGGARSGAFFSKGIEKRTVVFLLRLRTQITTHRQKANANQTTTYLLAEECLGVAIAKDPSGKIETRIGKDALDLLHKETGRNMEQGQKIHLLRQEIGSLAEKEKIFDRIAEDRAKELLADHRRVRAASDARGRYEVKPSKPVDIIGVYILMPMQA
ncbi:helicase-related protein [Thioalkalivibrio sp. HK1]|uniref:helicase-related protein n=1 Tax=Thioalkalivibrio sp. HK1 TaxID=1469245 RepID=UPI00047197BB|nr:helicase-related protein [Thioalkalivibrio sp. HK1]